MNTKCRDKTNKQTETKIMFVLLLMVGVVLAGDGRRRVLHLPGDLLLGGLFPMHEQVRQIQRQ